MRRGVLRNCCPILTALYLLSASAGSVHAQNRVKEVKDLTYPTHSRPVQDAKRTPIPGKQVSAVLQPVKVSGPLAVPSWLQTNQLPAAPIELRPSDPLQPALPESDPLVPLPRSISGSVPLSNLQADGIPQPAAPTVEVPPLPSNGSVPSNLPGTLPNNLPGTVPGPVPESSSSAPTVSLDAAALPGDELQDAATSGGQAAPTLVQPYWVPEVLRLSQIGMGDVPVMPVEYEEAIWDAVAHSPYVRALQLLPQINEAKITEAQGAFDPSPFVDSIFNDNSDPVGNTLTTGGPSRLNERRLDNGLGVRAKNQMGGSAEIGQNMTLRDNNSVFLAPKQQADSKMLVKLNQPLLRGAGRTYATASVRLAQLTVGISQHEATRKLQMHAQSIALAYWNLYTARSIELQAQRGIERLTILRDELRKRAEVDGLESQLKRAEAAVARQTSSLARAQADVVSATANLRALVNAPQWSSPELMFVPATPPLDEPIVADRTSELEKALSFHPDLLAARDRIKTAAVRLKVAENELRPTLNLVMESYLRGLNADYDVGNSLADQFSQGRPSYSGGLSYQRPYQNLISKSILKQRRLEMQQLLFDLDNTMLVITADVDQALAGVKATYAELEAAVKSTLAFDEEVRYLDGRWQNAFVESTGPSLLLDELLNAQNQLIQAENAWARAQADHMIAYAKLQLATGALLNTAVVSE